MAINLDLIGSDIDPITYTYSWRDVVVYALGAGAKVNELDFLYEGEGPKVLPTFAVVPAFKALAQTAARLKTDLLMVVHGEQTIKLHRPIPAKGTLVTTGKVANIYDKGTGALVILETTTHEKDGGTPVFDNTFSIFVRGQGGFGGDRGPKTSPSAIPAGEKPTWEFSERTSNEQHLLFRLNGDTNPIHASPRIAKMAGFERPILHGLCTYGHAGRAILHNACGGDPSKLKLFSARFTGNVLPGDTLITRGWKVAPNKHLIRVETQNGTTVIDNSVAEIVE
ncbi:MAG: MaoC/PaaZ C-terminal domain-containing protein [Kofleriaceae bacterium]